MEFSELKSLNSCTESEVVSVLEKFITSYSQVFSFPDLDVQLKKECVEAILRWLKKTQIAPKTSIACLQAFRIISRDKTNMLSLTNENALSTLIMVAGIQHYAQQDVDDMAVTISTDDQSVIVEAQKCLCNVIFNSIEAQRYCCKSGCVDGVVQRLKTYGDPDVQFDVKFFDMRILFLLTALPACVETRPKVRYELHGFTYLMEVLDLTLRDAENQEKGLTDQQVELCAEILKILFNLTISMEKKSVDESEEEEEAHFMRLVSILHDLLMSTIMSKDKQEDLQSHIINLLINIPADFYEELLTPMVDDDKGIDNKDIEYDGKNMEAIHVILEFLDHRLRTATKNVKENLAPILHCLCEACRHNRAIRKYCRLKVLPPLRGEVKRLPEEGDTLRNKLCKLLTSPVTEVKDLVAHFLFILCKENVSRMVKYTGYGNCAGLLAQFGLLKLGDSGQRKGDYSSNSEDSETEEYAELKDRVNPVTGRWEADKPDPMAGMTDEQKEYEANQLLNTIDKLQRQGVIQPCRVGEDGRPVAMEHVLELLEGQGGAEGGTVEQDED
ncbi:synembryn-A-like isoform X1 [Biomphalaria pfeifferi]|uniref:Synembryn-A-like isoform X1 n=1 Tax=Biomphalaria pfeifferi TaxID=112525 RepID=A0AAD8BIG0_BIOPF|nr:synembryn-A-like isoform X1 [Biomphalaria pfeifferi]